MQAGDRTELPWLLPRHFKMANPARHQHEIDRSFADYLVGDVKVTAPSIINSHSCGLLCCGAQKGKGGSSP
jgi:hypothetical protein